MQGSRRAAIKPKELKPANFRGRPVYVIDDDADLRKSLQFLLETRHADVSSFRSASDFLQAVDDLESAPLIVDVRMPRMDGLQLLAELEKRHLLWPAIFLSGHGEVSVAVQALKLGAIDFLEKPVVAAELELCVEKAFEKLDSQSSTQQLENQAAQRWALLTPREAVVLHHICEGCSNKEVAFILGLSPRTIEMHRAKALRQLQVRSLPEVMKLRNLANLPSGIK